MKGIALIVCLFSFFAAYSQAIISFEESVYDFGNIKEVDGPVFHDFVFVNRGNAPVLIKNVESSCGCTSPEWSKQPVLPGKTGYIRTIFDPKDRPSYFDKTITVSSNAQPAVVELKIRGNVEPRVRTVLDEYPYEQASGLRLPLDHISLMKVKKGESKQIAIRFYNNSGKKVTVGFSGLPAHVKISVVPEVVNAKEMGTLNVVYDTRNTGEYGLNEEEVVMVVDGKKYPTRLSAFVEEDFSGVDKVQAPVVQVEKKYYNFGILPQGQQARFVYKISNSGKRPLKIHRFYTNDNRLSVKVPEKELQPGAAMDIVVETVKGAGKGKLSGVISVITNSPGNPDMSLRFYGEIK